MAPFETPGRTPAIATCPHGLQVQCADYRREISIIAEPYPTPRPNGAKTEVWRSPGGIGAIASVAGVVVAIIAIFVTSGPGGPVQPSPSSTATYFFVYGTTMPGHLRYPLIEEFVAEATPDRVSGRLYDTGAGYPAAKFGGGERWIEGVRLEIRDGREAEARRTFTAFETGLFEPVSVRTESRVTVTAYEWIGSVEGFEEIEGQWDRPEE